MMLIESKNEIRRLKHRLNCFLCLFFRTNDYIKLVTELAQEQNFEATFISIEETTDGDQVQASLQLSTVPAPVAVCYGVGKDVAEAKSEAARNALSYLKFMAKKKVMTSSNGCTSNQGKVYSHDNLKSQPQPQAGVLDGV